MNGIKLHLRKTCVIFGSSLIVLAIGSPAGGVRLVHQVAHGTAARRLEVGKPVTLAVPADIPWTQTGVEVRAGEEILFSSEGKISLQKGNPESECGPEGYDIQAIGSPLPDKNLGALIGKVVVTVIETYDERTKEAKHEEIAVVFMIGRGGRVEMPAGGRLFLGINDNVVGDNEGAFSVTMQLSRSSSGGRALLSTGQPRFGDSSLE